MPLAPAPRGNLYYETHGQGEAVALLHGMWSDHRCWRSILPELARVNHVVLMDSMGHGRSARLAVPYSLSTYASDLNFLLESVGKDRIALVGFSMGASIALEYYFLHPGKVTSLVLIATPPPQKLRWRLGIAMVSIMERLGITTLKKESIKALSRRYAKGAQRGSMGSSLKELSAYDDKEFALILRSVWKTEGSGRESEVRVPTLIVVGEKDGVRGHSSYLKRMIPRSRLLLVPDANHAVIFTRPRLLALAIAGFLEEVFHGVESTAAGNRKEASSLGRESAANAGEK